MAKEVVSLTVEVESGQAISATKNLKSELKNATKELQQMLSANKENTQEYIDQRNKVAALQDKMRNFKEELKALDPEKKFQAIGSVASNIAGGFQAAQGAMALFGAESKDVEKALLKVQAATALAQGIDSIRTMGDSFRDLKLAIGGGIQSMGKLKTALIATGVGAFAVIVGAIAANWDEVKKAIDKAFPSLGGIANLFDNIKQVAFGTLASIVAGFKIVGETIGKLFTGDFTGAVDTAKTFGAEVSKAFSQGVKEEEEAQANQRKIDQLTNSNAELERLIKLEEAKGKDIYNIKKKLYKDELELLKLEKGKQSKEYLDKLNELEIFEAQHAKKLTDKANEKKELQEKIKQQLKDEAAKDAAEADEINLAADAKLKEMNQKDSDDKLKSAEADGKALNDLIATNNANILANEKKNRDESVKAAEAERLAKLRIAQDTLNVASNLGTLLIKDREKLEKFNKRAALIQIGIDTASAISSLVAASNGNPLNLLTGGVAGIVQLTTGMASITANILKAKQLLSGSGSSSAPSGGAVPSLGGTVPTTNATQPQVGRVTQEVTFADRDSINAGGTILKAYVSEQDITASQQRIRQIEERAKR